MYLNLRINSNFNPAEVHPASIDKACSLQAYSGARIEVYKGLGFRASSLSYQNARLGHLMLIIHPISSQVCCTTRITRFCKPHGIITIITKTIIIVTIIMIII